MRARIIDALRLDNGALRGLTGQGEVGLAVLLAGTVPQESAEELSLTAGSGAVSSVVRLARVYKDKRLAQVATGGGGGGGSGGGGGFGDERRDDYEAVR